MVKDDLWADPEDEFVDAEESSEQVNQEANSPVGEAAITMSSRTILKKIVLEKVIKSSSPTLCLSGQIEHHPQLQLNYKKKTLKIITCSKQALHMDSL